MDKELSVRLNGKEIGLLKLVKGKMEFTYAESTNFPISLSLPIQKESFPEKICRSFFGGLLPENENMRKLLAQKYNININDDFKLLKENGAIAFSNDGKPINNQDILAQALKTNELIISHAEIMELKGTPESEYKAVEREIETLKKTGGRYHLHIFQQKKV